MALFRMQRRLRPDGGFTILELMVTVVVLGIVVSLAFPSFADSMRKGRRSEAFAAIATIQQAQERWRANNPTYSDDLADVNFIKFSAPSRYTVTVSEPGGAGNSLSNGYIIEALGKNGQDSDRQCARLGIKMVNGNVTYAGCTGCKDLNFSVTDPCWSR